MGGSMDFRNSIPAAPTTQHTEQRRSATLAADLLVPLGQAAVTGLLVAAFFVVLVFEVAPDAEISRWKLWLWAALPVTAVTWLILLRETRRLMWGAEVATGRDLDGDGSVGRPPDQILQVHVRDGSRTQIVYSDDLGMNETQLVRFAQAVNRGQRLSPEAAWGKNRLIFPGGINDWRRTRTKLLGAGLIEKAGRSYDWTASGRAFIRRIVQYAEEGQADAAPDWMNDPRFADEYTHTHTRDRVLQSDTGRR